MDTPHKMKRGINYEALQSWLVAKTAGTSVPETSIGLVHESDLIKVGGLYRIRENYEAVWRMESNEDGKRYIVRADEGGDKAPERLLVTSEAATAGSVTAAKDYCTQCKEKFNENGECLCQKRDREASVIHAGDRSAYKVIHAGAVYVAWECEACATPNLTKFGNGYECDECHKRYADVLRTEDQQRQDKQTYTRAEVTEHSPEFGTRMATLGITVAHKSLLQAWEKEAEYQPKTGEPCSCKPGVHRDNCPDCEGTGKKIDFKKIRDKKGAAKPREAADDRCKQCRVPEHDSCPGKVGCPCCADSRREGAADYVKLREQDARGPKVAAKAVNPWAVCHESVGPEKSDKFEKCVLDVKKKSPIKE